MGFGSRFFWLLSGRVGGEVVFVGVGEEFHDVVRGAYERPFALGCGEASSHELAHSTVLFDLSEDWFDGM